MVILLINTKKDLSKRSAEPERSRSTLIPDCESLTRSIYGAGVFIM